MAALLGLTLTASSSSAQWSPIAPGLDYREMTLPGPVRVFIARADRATNSWTIDTMKAKGSMMFGHETVPAMAERYNDSITSDGHRYSIKVAINGDYYHPTTGVPMEGQIMAGWFVRRFGEDSGISGFVWTGDRRPFLGGSVHDGPALQRVTFADGGKMEISQLNEPRNAGSLALYTWHFSTNTATAADGVEVLLRMKEPLTLGTKARGEIVRVSDKTGSTPLPFNHAVLSAQGRAASELLRHARVGEAVSFRMDLQDPGKPPIKIPPQNWTGAYASLGGPKPILVNGTVPRDWEAKAKKYAEQGKKHGSVVTDPRTAIAYNDRYIFFAVIDGRSPISKGMTFTEAGFFCRDELKATDAILQDGGGSSTLWIDGKVRNIPSGKGKDEKYGLLRPVANGCFIAEVLPPKKSDAFREGQAVTVKGELRLGPGSTFGTLSMSASAGAGKITAEPLNGIYAKGTYWWHCQLGRVEGWASADQLAAAH